MCPDKTLLYPIQTPSIFPHFIDECVEIACNANVPELPQEIAFKRVARDNHNDEDQWELHCNEDESFMRVNENTDKTNAETDKNIGIEKMMIV